MKVQSTGLGKSVMIAHIHGLSITEFENEKTMKMTMESTEPLHWYIQVYMEPKDVRRALFMGLKPSIIWKGFLAILFNRFSIFSKAKPKKQPEEAGPPKAESPQVPLQPSASPSDKKAAASPLAKLKG